MKIPKSLQLHGQTIKVVHDNQLEHMTGSIGEARYRENQIVLQPNNKGINFPETKLEQVYCHELIHFILQHMDKRTLRDDEGFVEPFAQLLHQALTTAKYQENIMPCKKGSKKKGPKKKQEEVWLAILLRRAGRFWGS